MFVDKFFFDSFLSNPNAPALWVDGTTYSYRELAHSALSVSSKLDAALLDTAGRRPVGNTAPKAVLLFAYRSVNAYAGLLGILHTGYGYIPLSPQSPPERNLLAIRGSGVQIVLVDKKCEAEWALLKSVAPAGYFDDFRVVSVDTEPGVAPHADADVRQHAANYEGRHIEDLAYVLFTSGSTGTPKGVQISHASIGSFIGNESTTRPRAEGDRYSQFFDLTTDPSVEETFLCWASGACLYTMPKNDPLSVSAFLTEHQLTHFSSVPSTIAFLKQYRKLKPGMFPALKFSIFGGEAFRGELLQSWAKAAPNAVIRNMYGPTEATVAVANFSVDAAQVTDAFDGVLPIGKAMTGVELIVVDEAGEPVPLEVPGELLIGGVQLAIGYLGAREADAQRFISRTFSNRESTRWYRTGDLVRATTEPFFNLTAADGNAVQYRFLGRIDSQVKIRGNRIELQEVESVLAEASGATMTAAIALPVDNLGISPGIVGFISAPGKGAADDGNAIAAKNVAILQHCRQKLPAFAVPTKLIHVGDFPLNLAGKLDRLALLRQFTLPSENKPA